MNNFPVTKDGKVYWIARNVAVACFVFTPINGEWCVLANQRGKGTPDFQGLWNCPCGYLDYDETTKEAAKREVYEEVGIKVDTDKLQLIFTDIGYNWNGKPTSEINDIYVYEIEDYDASLAVSDEVAESRWLYPAEIKEMLDSGEFIELYSYFFEKIHKED